MTLLLNTKKAVSTSTHSNAGENYNDLALMFVDDGRFKIIAIYYWQQAKARYKSDSRQLEEFAKFNRDRL